MKISITNFKSIKSLNNFDLQPFSVLSGVNSSGKSSFIQLLLLIKQTIEADSGSIPLNLDGDLYKVREYKDIIYNQELNNKLSVSFDFSKEELLITPSHSKIEPYNYLADYTSRITVQFGYSEDNIVVNEFDIKFLMPDDTKAPEITFKRTDSGKYKIDTNDDLFGKGIWNKDVIAELNFNSFFPLYFQEESSEKKFVEIDWLKQTINSFFDSISYIGPLREQPKDEYSASNKLIKVSARGENLAQIVEKYATDEITCCEISENDDGITYKQVKKTFTEAIKYWMCDVFDLADNIYAEKVDESFKVVLVNKSGLSTTIKHVGFGISQLLPIIVEGLRMPNNGTLIIEQPEIHLHPKIQSTLYDFLYGLTLHGKKVIVETHSSHFITRMRRRIAESKEIDVNIGLTFIENDLFRNIALDDYGTLEYYPENFIEQSNKELKAIVKAQLKKRMKKS